MSGNGFCEQCGAALGEGLRFCENCGHPVGGAGSTTRSDVPITSRAAPGGGRRSTYLSVGGGLIALALIAFGWGRFGPQAAPAATPAPRASVATRTAAPTKVALAAAPIANPTEEVAVVQPPPMPTELAPAPTQPPAPTAESRVQPAAGLAIADLVGDWEIIDGGEDAAGQMFRIQQEADGRIRLRLLDELSDIPGIEDIEKIYLEMEPAGDELVGAIVITEDDVEVDRQSASISYLAKARVLTITAEAEGESLLAKRVE